jgi:hypothetical protein
LQYLISRRDQPAFDEEYEMQDIKKAKSQSKLQLNTNSVRHLNDAELKQVAGGTYGSFGPGYSYNYGACYSEYCSAGPTCK